MTGAEVLARAATLVAVVLPAGGFAFVVLVARPAFREAGGDPGAANAWAFVGGVPALVGTPYGRLLLAKLGLLVPLLALAAVNRFRERPRLGGPGAAGALRRLARNAGAEAGLAAAVLAVTGWLASTPPARHAEPVWPFGFRLTGAFLERAPTVESRLLVAVAIASSGVLALVAAALFRERSRPALVAAAVGIALGVLLVRPLWPFLAIDAYPTTYARPAAPYHVVSIAAGLALYREHCTACHGPSGRGDGPGGRGLPARPADLTAAHARDHTAGDLLWWISHGTPSGMPGFAGRLDEEARWDLVNVVRALGGGADARRLTPVPAPAPSIVAPDLEYRDYRDAAGRTQSLREARDRVVLLVLADPARAAERLTRLRGASGRLEAAGGEVVVVDPTASPDAATAYALLGGAPPLDPVEFLIDHGGYVRARWRPGEAAGWDDLDRLTDIVRALAAEPRKAPPADPHVH